MACSLQTVAGNYILLLLLTSISTFFCEPTVLVSSALFQFIGYVNEHHIVTKSDECSPEADLRAIESIAVGIASSMTRSGSVSGFASGNASHGFFKNQN